MCTVNSVPYTCPVLAVHGPLPYLQTWGDAQDQRAAVRHDVIRPILNAVGEIRKAKKSQKSLGCIMPRSEASS